MERKGNNEMNTPIIDFVNAYQQKKGTRFHMPGHKGHVFFGWEPFDITEIPGADVLHQGKGIIYESEKNATALFGTAGTFYATEGSTQCIKAMLGVLRMEWEQEKCQERPWILAARNVHRSMIDACALLDLDVKFLWGENSRHLCSNVISPEQLERALGQAAGKPLAVYITSPDYLGQQMDIKGLSRVCNREGVPLVVDNAHGAYLHFLEEKCHPMDLGAAMCCDSAHKTLPALTGGAYLHVHPAYQHRFLPYVRQGMLLFGSTSPSYLILQSLDYCNAYLSDCYEKRLMETVGKVQAWKEKFSRAGGKVLPSEPLKIVINTGDNGYTGKQIAGELRSYEIECEYEEEAHLVLMISPENNENDWKRLDEWGEKTRLLSSPKEKLPVVVPDRLETTQVMSIRQAVFSRSEMIPVEQAVHRICATETVSCPPAVPIAISGEEITEEMVREFIKFDIKEVSVVL